MQNRIHHLHFVFWLIGLFLYRFQNKVLRYVFQQSFIMSSKENSSPNSVNLFRILFSLVSLKKISDWLVLQQLIYQDSTLFLNVKEIHQGKRTIYVRYRSGMNFYYFFIYGLQWTDLHLTRQLYMIMLKCNVILSLFLLYVPNFRVRVSSKYLASFVTIYIKGKTV